MKQLKIVWPAVALALACVAFGAPVSGAGAAAKGGSARLVVSPKPGQKVTGRHLRIVVRSGPERGDLKARLNGAAIGARFRVARSEDRRVLDVSPVDGLRRGENVLRVSVARRGGRRHATVRFDIAHRRPLVSAGTDRRVVVGRRLRLRGLLRLDKSDTGRRKLTWSVVKAPAKSVLSAARGASAATPAPRALAGRDGLRPTFRPDARGRYRIKLTATSGNGTSVDSTTVYAVPPNPLITLKTAVPATAAEPRPGIQVGGEVLRAPYMNTAGADRYAQTNSKGLTYKALWQVVALDRATMALKWNRTYGVCDTETALYACTVGKNGEPVEVELAQELSALGPETLVIAASHPSGAKPELAWGPPEEFGYIGTWMTGIGLPAATVVNNPNELEKEVAAAKAGEMAAVGVPGLKPGEARFIVGGGETGLNGYLTPDSDPLPLYFFLPAARTPFDTRFASSCGVSSCTVAQSVGGAEVNGTVNAGQAGFLVSGFDRHTLDPVEHQAFTTAAGANEGPTGFGATETQKMGAYVKSLAGRGLLVAVTSVHGPSQSERVFFTPGTPAPVWQGLAEALVAIGGSREGFNAAATTLGSDYTLLGYKGLEEGAGQEFSGAGARLRGALVPSPRSLFAPQGVTSGETAPAELAIQTVLAPPQPSAWPLEGNAEAGAAIKSIGEFTKILGPDPRAAYATQLNTTGEATQALQKVEEAGYPGSSAGFSKATFLAAKKELLTEIKDVYATRLYMGELAQPAKTTKNSGWQEAIDVSAELEDALKQLKEEAQARAEWFSALEEGLEIVSFTYDVKGAAEAAKFFTAAAIAAEAGQTLWEVNYAGVPTKPSVTVKATELGKKLIAQAEANERSFKRMGDIIVSDWPKLKLIGTYANCDAAGGTCGPANEYEELSHGTEAEEVATVTTKRSADREVYDRLVPLAFPIWNTGLSSIQGAVEAPEAFSCGPFAYPFFGAPRLAYHRGLWEFDPVTQAKTWRVYLSVARSFTTYSWPPEAMLKRMFEPVPADSPEAAAGGLGIDPGRFMRGGLKVNEYVSKTACEREAIGAKAPAYEVARPAAKVGGSK